MNSPEQFSAFSSNLYDNRYSGTSNRKMDSQEQYEALLTSWGFNVEAKQKPSAVFALFSSAFKSLKNATKACVDSFTSTAPATKSQA